MIKIWLVSRTDNCSWDEYDSCVVAAETEEQARFTHPNDFGNWDGKNDVSGTWANADSLTVEYIGHSDRNLKPGVICSSFNAG